MTLDERGGKPSASSIERIHLCPGSWNLESTLPPSPSNDDAESGTRIHAALECNDPKGLLDDEEERLFERCRELRDDTLERIFGVEVPLTLREEKRFWLNSRFSGKADVVASAGRTLAILDYKTGRFEVDRAEGNLQLRALAVLGWLNHWEGLDRVVVAIIQPWAKEKVSLCEYSRDDMTTAADWLLATLDAAEKPDAPRKAGDRQCKYCRAVSVCPEAREVALTAAPDKTVALLSGPELSDFLNKVALLELVIDAVRLEAKNRLNAGDEVPGWRLKPGAVKEVIVDPEGVFSRFCLLGGSSREFMTAVTIAKGKLKEAVKGVTGAKGKALDEELDSLLAGFTEEKQNAASLEKEKEHAV